ncbi:hypothetical protein [Bradyrhizobium sp. WSM2254]|uniref:hypothetical protein n=1 Tax=Bradyrhizobium sp. WSM2254 TaxID=1188263 RepID=UPI0018DC827C|nr:hypothetical protein [Bradyrhizobium sp. WSM2254]
MQTIPMASWNQRKPVRRGAAVTAPSVLEIIKNLPTRLIDYDLGLQDDPVSQILWLIVASAAGTLVYHIPEGKPNLVMQRKKSARFPSGQR